jgi:hypothetical protein
MAEGSTNAADASSAASTPVRNYEAGVPVTDADGVIASLRPLFKACYQEGLKTDRTMSGKVVVQVIVAADGHVSESAVAENVGLSNGVADCIRGAVAGATFGPPGKPATLRVPVTFVQKGK